MKTVTARIPESLLSDIEGIEREEQAERAQVIRKLLDSAVRKWKTDKALEELREGRVTLRTASRRAGLTYVEMLDRTREAGISIDYSMNDLHRDISSLRAE